MASRLLLLCALAVDLLPAQELAHELQNDGIRNFTAHDLAAATGAAPAPVPPPSAGKLPLISIFTRSVTAVAQTLSMAMIGAIFARMGILDANSRKVLSTLSMKITIPCLLFSNILDCPQRPGQAADACPDLRHSLVAAWPMLLLPFLWVAFGALTGRVASFLAPRNLKGTAIVACAFPNSTGLPITLLSALSNVPLTKDPTPSTQMRAFLLMLSIYQITYPVLQWGIGGRILKERKVAVQAEPQELGLVQPDETPLQQQSKSRMDKVREVAGVVLVPPVIAVFVGFFVGLIPQVKLLFVDSLDFDDDMPLEFFFNAVLAFGKAAVPMNMMVLGASLASIPSFASVQWPLTAAVAACKLVVHPALGFGLIYAFDSAGYISAIAGTQRPFLIVVSCLVCATPTANNVQVMAEVNAGAESKRALSAMIFVMYCLAPFILTFWIVLAISMAQS